MIYNHGYQRIKYQNFIYNHGSQIFWTKSYYYLKSPGLCWFFHETWWFFEVSEIPRTSRFLNLIFFSNTQIQNSLILKTFKYPELTVLCFWIFQIPGTGGYAKIKYPPTLVYTFCVGCHPEGDYKKCLAICSLVFSDFLIKNLPKAPLLLLVVALLSLIINPNCLQLAATTLCHHHLHKRESLILPCAWTFHRWMHQFHHPKKDQIVNLVVEHIGNWHTSTIDETTIVNPHWWTNKRLPQGFTHWSISLCYTNCLHS